MTNFITEAQYEELIDADDFSDETEFHKLLNKYTGIEARPYTAYSYFDSARNYIGDSNETDLDDLLRAAYVEVQNDAGKG